MWTNRLKETYARNKFSDKQYQRIYTAQNEKKTNQKTNKYI